MSKRRINFRYLDKLTSGRLTHIISDAAWFAQYTGFGIAYEFGKYWIGKAVGWHSDCSDIDPILGTELAYRIANEECADRC